MSKFGAFDRLFDLKMNLSGENLGDVLANTPSQGVIARIVSHRYPRGGGGQAEHIDPVSPFAKIQTLIQASSQGIDYNEGGLYLIHPTTGRVAIDGYTRKGDLILMSPGVRHGVAPIDPDQTLDWTGTDGRWIIMPIIIHSDHVSDAGIRPRAIDRL